jgi:hypothetical protein
MITARWCRREWSSPPDTRANDQSRRVLYSSVFLGSPGECYLLSIIYFHNLILHATTQMMIHIIFALLLLLLQPVKLYRRRLNRYTHYMTSITFIKNKLQMLAHIQ